MKAPDGHVEAISLETSMALRDCSCLTKGGTLIKTPDLEQPLPFRHARFPLLGYYIEARRAPLAFIRKLSRQSEPLMAFNIAHFRGCYVNHPDGVNHILQSNHRNYSKDNLNYRTLKPVIGEGLITSEGDHWLRQRRMIQPAFHHSHQIRFAKTVQNRTSDMLENWQHAEKNGAPLELWNEMTRLTLRVIAEFLFGVDIQDVESQIEEAFDVVNAETSYRLRTLSLLPRWVPTRRNRRFQAGRSTLEKIVYKIINDRCLVGKQPDDLLAHLLTARDDKAGEGMRDRQVRDEVMTMLLAGHETSATLLTWTFYMLANHPEWMDRLVEETDAALGGRTPTLKDLVHLEDTQRTLKEALRLYPPVWILSRTAQEEDSVCGYSVPPGMNMILSPYAMHRHPDYWDRPERFDPDRFSERRSRDRHPFSYFPFGSGPRRCIGSELAIMEAGLIVTMVLQRYRIKPANGDLIAPEPWITLRPRPTPRLILESREG